MYLFPSNRIPSNHDRHDRVTGLLAAQMHSVYAAAQPTPGPRPGLSPADVEFRETKIDRQVHNIHVNKTYPMYVDNILCMFYIYIYMQV